jgi:hypothetical protein
MTVETAGMRIEMPNLPAFTAEMSLYKSEKQYKFSSDPARLASAEAVVPQLPWRCWLHAAACLSLTENPLAADLCWEEFAENCAGATD